MDSIVACKTCGQLQRAGGIAFATPDNPGDTPAKNSMRFPLYDEPMKGWLEWTPKIRVAAVPN